MIGYLVGEVLLSDGNSVMLLTSSGVAYEVEYHHVLTEGEKASLFIGHIFRENDQQLFGFNDLKSKKLFELLLTVKGVGPKSSYSIVTSLGTETICSAIMLGNEKTLSSAPGVGKKTAAQILLDLKDKIKKVKMFSESYASKITPDGSHKSSHSRILDEAIMACKELGFKENEIHALATKILETHEITKPEQLVHLVLKEL